MSNWDCGCAIAFLGIFVLTFSVGSLQIRVQKCTNEPKRVKNFMFLLFSVENWRLLLLHKNPSWSTSRLQEKTPAKQISLQTSNF
jgi:hypothetical protein